MSFQRVVTFDMSNDIPIAITIDDDTRARKIATICGGVFVRLKYRIEIKYLHRTTCSRTAFLTECHLDAPLGLGSVPV
jgi:hypothetical protein